MTYRIDISTWYNHSSGADKPAIPEAPELGAHPHAQLVMKHYGISYARCQASPIADSWYFFGCDKRPDVLQRWMTVHEEPNNDAG